MDPRHIEDLADAMKLERDWLERLAVASTLRPGVRTDLAVRSAQRELDLARETVALHPGHATCQRRRPAPTTVRAVVALPGQPARVVEDFDASPASLAAFVGGTVEVMPLGGGSGAVLVVADEGLNGTFLWNRWMDGEPVAGPMLILGADEKGEVVPLSTLMAARARGLLNISRIEPTLASEEDKERLEREAKVPTPVGMWGQGGPVGRA